MLEYNHVHLCSKVEVAQAQEKQEEETQEGEEEETREGAGR